MSELSSFVRRFEGRSGDDAGRATRMRDIANTLLKNDVFVDWAGDAMVFASYFGEGRELTPYQQGLRGGVVRLFETLIEASDNGPEFLARVFAEKVMGKVDKTENKQ